MLYIQYINNSVPLCLYLHIYSGVPWKREGRGGVRCGECGKMLQPLPLFRTLSDLCKMFSEKFPNCRSFGQSRFTQQAVVIYSCLTYQYYDSVKGYEIVNRTTSSNTLKQLQLNHLVGLNLYFLTPLFWYRHTTAYICIHNITQVKYL